MLGGSRGDQVPAARHSVDSARGPASPTTEYAAALCEPVAGDRHRERGDAVGGFCAQPRHRVADLGIADEFDERVLVGVEVDARHRREGGCRRGGQVAPQQSRDGGVAHCGVHVAKPAEPPEVGQRLVAADEQAQLRRLIGGDVGHELPARLVERRTAVGEVVFDHPPEEGFTHDGPRVPQADELGHVLDVLRRRHGGDAIDHRAGERDVLTDPGGEFGVGELCERHHHGAGEVAVARDVVAAHHPERRLPTAGTQTQGRGEEGEHRRGRRPWQQVRDHVRGRRVEPTGGGVDVVAAFGDRERHDPRLGRAVGVLDEQGVELDLGLEHLLDHPIVLEQTGPADGEVARATLLQELVEHHRLVRPVEGADLEVHDAGDQTVAVIPRARDPRA